MEFTPKEEIFMDTERAPVTLTTAELWLLNDFIRHEMPEARNWRYPPVSEELNDEVAFALDSCESHGLSEYTLMLSRGDLLAIDYTVRRDHKTPEGASGKSVLLKSFRARKQLSIGFPDHLGDDRSYREVGEHAAADIDTNDSSF